MKKYDIAIMQPTFLPWIGYFAMISSVKKFILLDSVQFDKRSWQQRNRIKTATGVQWLTIPVFSKGKVDQEISDVQIQNEGKYPEKLIKSISMNYTKAKYFSNYSKKIFEILDDNKTSLCELNIKLIKLFVELLEIKDTSLSMSSELNVQGTKSELLVNICNHFNAKNYLSPPGSKCYIEESKIFEKNDIKVDYHDYKHPDYHQLYGDFQSHLPIIDLLFNEGPNSMEIINKGLDV